MTHALELSHTGRHAGAADRLTRSSRAAYDRILDRTAAAERQMATDALAEAVRRRPELAREQDRIKAQRNRLARRSETLAVIGAFAIIGLVAGLCLAAAPLAAQAGGIVAGALGLAGFRLAMLDGRHLIGLQILLQLFASIALFALAGSGATLLLFAAIAAMGWGALGLRAMQLTASRRLDIDEVELMLEAQGRQTLRAVRADVERRIAAAI